MLMARAGDDLYVHGSAGSRAKARTGPPHGDPLDEDLDTWEGVIPMVTRFGEPESAPGLSEGVGLAPSVRTLLSHRPDGRGGDTGS